MRPRPQLSSTNFRIEVWSVRLWSTWLAFDHTLTDQTSVLKFVEDNWGLGRIGDYSFDSHAGSLDGMLNFRGRPNVRPVLLSETTGAVVRK